MKPWLNNMQTYQLRSNHTKSRNWALNISKAPWLHIIKELQLSHGLTATELMPCSKNTWNYAICISVSDINHWKAISVNWPVPARHQSLKTYSAWHRKTVMVKHTGKWCSSIGITPCTTHKRTWGGSVPNFLCGWSQFRLIIITENFTTAATNLLLGILKPRLLSNHQPSGPNPSGNVTVTAPLISSLTLATSQEPPWDRMSEEMWSVWCTQHTIKFNIIANHIAMQGFFHLMVHIFPRTRQINSSPELVQHSFFCINRMKWKTSQEGHDLWPPLSRKNGHSKWRNKCHAEQFLTKCCFMPPHDLENFQLSEM